MHDPYEVLNVSPSCEDVVIRAAYRALIAKYHPDRFTGDPAHAERMSKRINQAYTVLGDPESRAAFDALGTARSAAAGPPATASQAAASTNAAPTPPTRAEARADDDDKSVDAQGANDGPWGTRREAVTYVRPEPAIDVVRAPEPPRRPFGHRLWLVLGLAAIPILYFHGLGTPAAAPPAPPPQALPWSDDPDSVRSTQENNDTMDAAAQAVERFRALERASSSAQPASPVEVPAPAGGNPVEPVQGPASLRDAPTREAAPSTDDEPVANARCTAGDGGVCGPTLAGGGNPRPSFDGINRDDRTIIEMACVGTSGVTAHNSCLREQVAALRNGNARPSFDGVSREDRTTIEMACVGESGIVAHNRCLRAQLRELQGN